MWNHIITSFKPEQYFPIQRRIHYFVVEESDEADAVDLADADDVVPVVSVVDFEGSVVTGVTFLLSFRHPIRGHTRQARIR